MPASPGVATKGDAPEREWRKINLPAPAGNVNANCPSRGSTFDPHR
jgi:hypothetical protein